MDMVILIKFFGSAMLGMIQSFRNCVMAKPYFPVLIIINISDFYLGLARLQMLC